MVFEASDHPRGVPENSGRFTTKPRPAVPPSDLRSQAAVPWVQFDEQQFFHGTSESNLARAGEKLSRPYVTDSEERAWYYAKEAATEDESDPVVVLVLIPGPEVLAYDGYAMDEPVLADDAGRDAAWGRAGREHPDWQEGGCLIVPSDAWEVSWVGVGSAKTTTDLGYRPLRVY
jgi:hypothetical protein